METISELPILCDENCRPLSSQRCQYKAELWCFLILAWTSWWTNNPFTCGLRHMCCSYDVILMGHLRSHSRMGIIPEGMRPLPVAMWRHCNRTLTFVRHYGNIPEGRRTLPVAVWRHCSGTLTFTQHDGNMPGVWYHCQLLCDVTTIGHLCSHAMTGTWVMRPLPFAMWRYCNGTLTFTRHDGNIPEGMRPLPVACRPTLLVVTGF